MKQKNMPVIHGPFTDTYDYGTIIKQGANEPVVGRVVQVDEPKPKQKIKQRINKLRGK